jgi:hypothetical protein
VLWAVFNMGVRFMELYKRRMKRIEVYQRMYDKAVTDEEKDVIAACHEQLVNKMHTVQGMDDIDAKFKRALDLSVSFARFRFCVLQILAASAGMAAAASLTNMVAAASSD